MRALGIVVCGNLAGAHDRQLSYLLQDCSAAIENMLLAAQALGLGACWLGVHPREDRVAHVRSLVGPVRTSSFRSALFPSVGPRNRPRPHAVSRGSGASRNLVTHIHGDLRRRTHAGPHRRFSASCYLDRTVPGDGRCAGRRGPSATCGQDVFAASELLWTVKLGDHQYTVPRVDGDRIFIGINDTNIDHPAAKSTGGGILMCFDRASGALVWQLPIPALHAGHQSAVSL